MTGDTAERKRKQRSKRIPFSDVSIFCIFANTSEVRLQNIPVILASHGTPIAAHIRFDAAFTRQQIVQWLARWRKELPTVRWTAQGGYTEAGLQAFAKDQEAKGAPVHKSLYPKPSPSGLTV